MKKPIFTPEDFDKLRYSSNERPCDAFASFANAKLEKLIESWPIIYGFEEEDGTRYFTTEPQCKSDTHCAQLAFIEELPKEECKHMPSSREHKVDGRGSIKSHCQLCGIELVADWRAK